MTLTVDEAGLAIADPKSYADDRRLHESLALLRRESPVHRVNAPGYNPFWAVTRHADVLEVERDHQLFLNAPRPLLATAELDELNRQRAQEGVALRTLIHMDDPDHR
ncbi:MAG: cytochrome P450, partial [Actinomycetes bacterium]